jgi:hypothetical protein
MLIPNSKKALLIDGIGAIISAISLGIISKFQPHFGMPALELRILVYCAGCFAIYSMSTYFFGGEKWRNFLRVIACVNLLYSLGSILLLIINAAQLTLLGWLYFIPEIIIVSLLAIQEWRISNEVG